MNLDFKFNASEIVKQKRTTEEDIKNIKQWLIVTSEKFIPSKIQDEMIVLFLLSCDNIIELTKKTIISYYKLRKKCPNFFDQRNMERKDLQIALQTVRMASIPVRTDDNDAVIYFSLRDTNYRNFELVPIMKASYMLIDIQQEGNPPDGIIYLVDMEGFGAMHITKMRPDPLNKYFTYLGEGLPTKFKAMHFLNANYVLDKLLAIISKFLHPDVMRRLHIHQPGEPLEELSKTFPKKCLPKELGGDLESHEELCKNTIKKLENKENFWEIEENLRKDF